MKFKITKEYPQGSIVATESDLELLKSKGWSVSMHTPYYTNFIGAKLFEMRIGFGCWMSNLEFYAEMCDHESGCYYIVDGYNFDIKSQADLNKVIKYIDGIIELNKLLESIPKKK